MHIGIEISESAAVQAYVTVIRPGDGTDDDPCRPVYQLRIGQGGFSVVVDTSLTDPPEPDREDLYGEIAPCFCTEAAPGR